MSLNMKFELLSEIMDMVDLINFKLTSEEYRKLAFTIGQLFKQLEQYNNYDSDELDDFEFTSFSSGITTDDEMDNIQYEEHRQQITNMITELTDIDIYINEPDDVFGFELLSNDILE